jgi:hypothetical protein
MTRCPWNPDPETILADVLAAQDDRRRPGDSMLVRVRIAMAEGRARAKRERQRAARNRCYARQRARGIKYRAKDGWSIADRMIRIMEPGKWYGVGDVARALGEPRSSRAKMTQVLLARGLVTRTKNAARCKQLNPWQIMAGREQEPDWLYRLSGSGEAYRAKLLSSCVAPGAHTHRTGLVGDLRTCVNSPRYSEIASNAGASDQFSCSLRGLGGRPVLAQGGITKERRGRLRVKSGNSHREHMLSALPPKADIRSAKANVR